VVFLGSFCGSLQDPTAILGPVRPMFGKARDLPRGRSARLVRHDRVRRLLSLGGRSSGRLSEDLANPPLGLRSSPPDLHPRQRARTAPHTTVAERAVGHRVARGVHHPPGQVDSSGLLPERSSGRTWAPCPGPPRREGGWENPHESGRSRQRVAEGALDRLPLWPWSRRQFAGG
jgi:hypothetical protein